jgi:hypothetical protein
VMTYWTMCPLLSIIGAFFFVGTYVVYKHQFLYVFTREFETGGQFWYQLFDSSMFCLVISCTLITAYVSVKGGISQAALLFPLPFTVWYCWCNITNQYEHRSANMAFNCAVSSDENHLSHSALLSTLVPDCYKQPCMKPEATTATPYPHRLEEKPLLVKASNQSKFKTLHSIYISDVARSFDEVEAFYHRLEEKYFLEDKQLDRSALLSSHHSSQSLAASIRGGGGGLSSSSNSSSPAPSDTRSATTSVYAAGGVGPGMRPVPARKARSVEDMPI